MERRVQRAAFLHVPRATCRCRAQGSAFSLKGVISQNKLQLFFFVRYYIKKKTTNGGGAETLPTWWLR